MIDMRGMREYNIECVLLSCNFDFFIGYWVFLLVIGFFWLLGGYCLLPSGYCSFPILV